MKRAIAPPPVEKTRYSDEELEEFKKIILGKLEKAHNDLKLLTESYTNNPHDISDTSPTFKVLEEGYQVFSKEENSKSAARQEKFIKNLENALIRIENKTYGICRGTGKLIPADRLRCVPHATLTIEAKKIEGKINGNGNGNGKNGHKYLGPPPVEILEEAIFSPTAREEVEN